MVYVDTSAVLPYYRAEEHSRAIEAFFRASAGQIAVSQLVRVEFFSALGRWVRFGELTQRQAQEAERIFLSDFKTGCYQEVSINTRVFELAIQLLQFKSISLRALDAIHLAATIENSAQLLTFDRQLQRAAEEHGVNLVSL
jgi:predicted nucleic acid-binding protein